MACLPESIDTTRLLLRRPTLDDAQGFFDAYTSDPQVPTYMTWTPHRDVSEEITFLKYCIDAWEKETAFAYALVAKSEPSRPIGMIEAMRRSAHMFEIGYVLARSHWGQGLMPEALVALSEIALARPGIYRLQAGCDVDNTASMRTLEKAGYVREARLERYTVHPNISDEPRPCFLYARWR